jgi:hypothetical protein
VIFKGKETRGIASFTLGHRKLGDGKEEGKEDIKCTQKVKLLPGHIIL